MAGAKPLTPCTYTCIWTSITAWSGSILIDISERTSCAYDLTFICSQPQLRSRIPLLLARLQHGVPGHDLAVHSGHTEHSSYPTGQIAHSHTSTTRNKPPSSNLSRTTSFCNRSISSRLLYEPIPTSTSTNIDDCCWPTLDESSHDFADTTVSSYTTEYAPAHVWPISLHSSATDMDTKITAFIHFTRWTQFSSSWLRWTSHRHPSSGTMETRCRIPRHQQGEWTGLSVQNTPKPILQLQRHRGNGSFAGAPLEVLISRYPKYLVETHRLRPGNLCHSVWQHWHDSIYCWTGVTATFTQCGPWQVGDLQVSLCRTMCQPKRSYSEHGQGSCSTTSIMASFAPYGWSGKSTTHYNVFWNLRRSWPKWKRKVQILHPTHRHLHHHRHHRLNELSMAKLLLRLLSTPLLSWYHLDQLTLGSLTTNLIRWRRPNISDGWKIWNFLNTNLIRWPNSWRKSKNGGTNNLTRHPKPSNEPV